MKHIKSPVPVKSAGTKFKLVEEFVGKVSSCNSGISMAKMKPPAAREENRNKHGNPMSILFCRKVQCMSKQAIINANKGETILHSTLKAVECRYIADCLPVLLRIP